MLDVIDTRVQMQHWTGTARLFGLPAAALSWSHATNSVPELEAAVVSGVQFIEADICWAGAPATAAGPVMGHDLDHLAEPFDVWLHRALELAATVNRALGLKLDFKHPAAVGPCLATLASLPIPDRMPIWLNADVLPGPRGRPPVFDAVTFVQECSAFARRPGGALLSVGWTTGAPRPDHCDASGVDACDEYTEAQLAAMADLLGHGAVAATLPVRATLMTPAACAHFRAYLDRFPDWSLTVWQGAEGCPAQRRQQLLDTFGPDRLFVDLRDVP